jgi:mannose-1-phosphate guanylyltransferase
MRLHPVILAGGRGERFWPLSRRSRPKQLLPLLSARSMLADTVGRLAGVARTEDTFVLTARDLVPAVREAAPGIPAHHVVGEPVGKNTAPAVALAAWWLRDAGDDAVAVVLPSDHRIEPAARFREEVEAAAHVALERGVIVTLGIPPTRPEIGYGYIEVGDPLEAKSPFHAIRAFREKPDVETAARYVADGRHLWNAGMFLFAPSVMLREMKEHAPDIAAALPKVPPSLSQWPAGTLERYSETVPSISIDYAVMERTKHAAVARAGFAWDDLGSWAALSAPSGSDGGDAARNVVRGRALLHDSSGVIAFSEGGLVAGVGLRDLVVVHTGDVTLVCPRDRAQEVREIVSRLKREPDGDAFL